MGDTKRRRPTSEQRCFSVNFEPFGGTHVAVYARWNEPMRIETSQEL